jgi:hypothetical protein
LIRDVHESDSALEYKPAGQLSRKERPDDGLVLAREELQTVEPESAYFPLLHAVHASALLFGE